MADPKKYPQLQDAIDQAAVAAADAAPIIADADAAQADLDAKTTALKALTGPSAADIDHNEACKAAQAAAAKAAEDKAVAQAKADVLAAEKLAQAKISEAEQAATFAASAQEKVEQLNADLDAYEADLGIKDDGGGDAIAVDPVIMPMPPVKVAP